MKIFRAAAIIALVMAPAAYAQSPSINLMPEVKTLTPEEKEALAQRDKAYQESLKKIPDAKTSTDPWGVVRSEPAKTPAKTKTKTGSTAN